MTAAYPASIASFSTKVNVIDSIDASHPNLLQDEVEAIETILGITPNISTTPSSGGTFNATSNPFLTVSARLANIETGIVSDTHTQYIKKAGDTGNIITAGAATTKPLILKGAASHSANLTEWQNSSGTVLSYIDNLGNFSGGVTLQDLTISNKTANYTLALTDKNAMIVVDSASAVTITVPDNSSVAFPQGAQVHILRKGAGTVQVVGAGSASVVGAPGLFLRATNSSATLIKLNTSQSFVLVGDLSTS
jgi:hypothetical protein